MISAQQTLNASRVIVGIGVHSGEPATLTLHPASENTGVVFQVGNTKIPAKLDYVDNTDFCTCLLKDGVRIATVEHLLSAFHALNIDNCVAELSTNELPILDGSAKPWVDLILSAGIAQQSVARKFLAIKKEITVHDQGKWAKLAPFEGFSVSMEIAFTHPVILKSKQSLQFECSPERYIQEISQARTFGFMVDYEMMLAKNLARGASLQNTVVLDAEIVVNPEGLRYPDEFVKHKILDAIGDLYLSGHPIRGSFSGYKSGHTLNANLMKKLLETPDAFEVV